ncbi:hypothetical protein ANANG_G00085480 [Anguilla anguilla]|uniref:Uncharacterized protein n=1 Tax=Anguilla anguilla TaxID=7936 RepID=A0A9D3S0J4_ANGAN|nr:hypothetical protein ANANG_G00085480 [Anguilla anguilla]
MYKKKKLSLPLRSPRRTGAGAEREAEAWEEDEEEEEEEEERRGPGWKSELGAGRARLLMATGSPAPPLLPPLPWVSVSRVRGQGREARSGPARRAAIPAGFPSGGRNRSGGGRRPGVARRGPAALEPRDPRLAALPPAGPCLRAPGRSPHACGSARGRGALHGPAPNP